MLYNVYVYEHSITEVMCLNLELRPHYTWIRIIGGKDSSPPKMRPLQENLVACTLA